jgi:predicted dehydrogenase
MPISLAFYGAGELAQPYLRALAARSDVRVLAVCDPDPRAAEEAAAGWGARVLPHYTPLLQEDTPDALFVCVPPRLLGDVLEQAATLSLPFFVEAPGAADWDGARRLAHTLTMAPMVTAVGYHARYTDLVQEGKGYLAGSAVALAHGTHLADPREPGQTAADVFWNEGCRLLDALRFLAGPVARVAAVQTPAGVFTASLETTGGTAAVVAVAACASAEPRAVLDLFGAGWHMRYERNLSALRLDERDKTTILRQVNVAPAAQAAAFLDAVRAGDPTLVTPSYPEAAQTLAVCQAALRAAQESRWVEVAELTGGLEVKPRAETVVPDDAGS